MNFPAQNAKNSSSSKQTVLVSGGANFLGSHLCRALIGQDCQVFCFDDLTSAKKENVSDLLGKENFFFFEHDISNFLPKGLPKFSYIFHLAGIDEYLAGRDLTLETLLVNSEGTKNLLDRAKEDGAKFLLASSLEVYSGILSAGHLKNYFGLGLSAYRHHTHHEAKRYAEALTVSYFERFGIDARIVRIIDVYGPGMLLETGSIVSSLIKEALEQDTLTIPADGLELVYPTYIDDVVYGMLRAAFGHETSGGIFNLVNLEEITALNFAYALRDVVKKIQPQKELKLKFDQNEPTLKFPVPKEELLRSQHELNWSPKTKLEDGLKLTLESFLTGKKYWQKENLKVESVFLSRETKYKDRESFFDKLKDKLSFSFSKFKLPHFTVNLKLPIQFRFQLRLGIKKASVILVFLLLFNFFLLPLFQFLIGGFFGLRLMSELKEKSRFQSIQNLRQNAKKANFFFNGAKKGLDELSWIFYITGQRKNKDFFNNLLESGVETSLALENIADSSVKASELIEEVLSGKVKREQKEEVAKIKIDLQKTSNLLGLAGAKISGDFLPANFASRVKTAKEEIIKIKRGVDLAILGLEILPEVLGLDGQKSYLLLFQNNSELRPTGGFIGSYGVLDFSNGTFKNVLIDDVYNLDGQIKEQIEPPEPLKRSLGVSSWGLRDSNWDPDFTRSAKVAENFYSKVFGKKVDGVFALDQTSISRLLDVLGPIKLEDYGETITSQNLTDRAQYYAEIGFTPGSTRKKDFLGEVAGKIMEKLKDKKQEKNWPKIFSALYESLVEKHILLYFENPNIESVVAWENWTGSLKPIPIDQESATFINDYLALFEANIGANKSNQFLERQIILNPVIQRDGDLVSALTINYNNRSLADTWPGGVYKSYLRIYLPKGSKLEALENGANYDLNQVDKVTEGDKEVWGIFIEVGVGQSKKIRLKYRTPYRIKIEGNYALWNLLFQKQPGTGMDSLTVELSFPLYLKPSFISPDGVVTSEQTLKFETKLGEDRFFQVKFTH